MSPLFLLPLLLACLREAPPPPLAAPAIRAVAGPWVYGSSVTVAAGQLDGGPVVMAAWLQGEQLLVSSSTSAGAEWTVPLVVDTGVQAGDGGQIRPRMVLTTAADGTLFPTLAYAIGGRPQLAMLEGGAWATRALSGPSPGSGALLDIGVVRGEVVVAWLDTRRDPENWVSDVYAWYRGSEELVYSDLGDGVCVCCRPAVGEWQEQPAIAFRDQDGPNREVRVVVHDRGAWSDVGLVTHGGWAPGGCPSDGPVFDQGEVLVSDGRDGTRRLYRKEVLVSGAGEAPALQPRAVAGARLWIEPSAAGQRWVLDRGDGVPETVLLTAGPLESGDPVMVGDELWLPWQGDQAGVLAVPWRAASGGG